MSKDQHKPAALDAYIQKLSPDLAELVQGIRSCILAADPSIGEQIKWNSPAFFYTGDLKDADAKTYPRDLIVIHLRKGYALLIFPSGARIADPDKFLEGDYADGRRMLSIHSLVELDQKKTGLQNAIRSWLSGIPR